MQANTGQGQGNNQQKSTLSGSQPAVTSTPSNAKPVSPVVSMPPSNKQNITRESHTGTYVGIFVAGLIIGALIGWSLTSRSSGTPSGTASSTMTASTSTTGTTTDINLGGSQIGSGSMVTVASPQTSGFAVSVGNVQDSQPTWVVIYEDRAGAQGNALGAALFLPQTGNNTQNGTVQLLRATLPGQNYFAGEATDDGDKVFSLQTDKLVTDTSGHTLLVQFSTK